MVFYVNSHMIDLWPGGPRGANGLTLVTDATAARGDRGMELYSLGDFEIEVRAPLCSRSAMASLDRRILYRP
jgi:N-acetylglucosamine-6-phosphate deacetylase